MTAPGPLAYEIGMNIRLQTASGAALLPLLPVLARLRIAVFREFPYLYEGDQTGEETHLRSFASTPSAGLIVAWDGDEAIGCATCMRLTDASEGVRAPFRAAGMDPAAVFYFGESVLLPAYRGQGIGVGFFTAREAHARAVSSCDIAAFCAVIRPPDHPMRPPGAVGLEAFWRKRGYTPTPNLGCAMRWTEIGGTAATEHQLSFWLKSLSGKLLP